MLTSLYSLIALRRRCGSAWTAGVGTGAGETVELERVATITDLEKTLLARKPVTERVISMMMISERECEQSEDDGRYGDVDDSIMNPGQSVCLSVGSGRLHLPISQLI